MKKLEKFRLSCLLIFLSIALVFVEGNFLEGQKGKKPPGDRVKVHIPPPESGYNLYGTTEGYYVDDDTYVFASGNKSLRSAENHPYYVFLLTLCNTNSWGDPCPQEGEYNMPGLYTIGFENISIAPLSVVYPDEGSTCFFPPKNAPAPICWGGQAPHCMECFLNNWPHPSSWACVDTDQGLEYRGYMGAYIKVKVFDEIWNYPMGVPIQAEISLYISVYTGRLAYEGEDFYHDIEIHIHRPENDPYVDPYVADVTRFGEDSWNIVFDSIIPKEDLVVFKETYDALLGEVKPKGKSGQDDYEYEEHTTMIATADHFSFNISWISY